MIADLSTSLPEPDASYGIGFARGLAVGVILGGAVVLIFTPRTGEEIREWVGEAAQVLVERVTGALTGEASSITPAANATASPTPPV